MPETPAPKAASRAKPRGASPPGSVPAPPAAPTNAHPAHPSLSSFPVTPKVIDASGLVLGRAASLIAQRLLKGEHVVVVNAEKAVVVGGRESILANYRESRARGSVRKGPFYPRRPDRIFRRTVRGMLPYRHDRGRDAFHRVMAYVGVPGEFAALPRETLEPARLRPSLRPPMTLGEISRLLGAVGPW